MQRAPAADTPHSASPLASQTSRGPPRSPGGTRTSGVAGPFWLRCFAHFAVPTEREDRALASLKPSTPSAPACLSATRCDSKVTRRVSLARAGGVHCTRGTCTETFEEDFENQSVSLLAQASNQLRWPSQQAEQDKDTPVFFPRFSPPRLSSAAQQHRDLLRRGQACLQKRCSLPRDGPKGGSVSSADLGS